MTELQFVSPLSFSMSGGNLQREFARLQSHRQPGYELAYDRNTVFYDLRIDSNGYATFICPPLMNFSEKFQVLADHKLLKIQTTAWDRTEKLRGKIPQGTRMITIRIGDESLEISPGDLDTPKSDLSGMRVLQTHSRDNPIEWIQSWASFYSQRHGTEAILLYDNGSRDYSVEQLGEALCAVKGISKVVIVAWNFPYGPGGGTTGSWDSDFCQIASMAHSQSFFTSKSKSVINADIDELMLTPFSISAHSLAERSPLGGVSVRGVWIENNTTPAVKLPKFIDFSDMEKNRKTRAAPPKWVVVPSRLPKWVQLRPHRLKGWYLPSLPGLTFRHFRGMTTSWRKSSLGWQYGIQQDIGEKVRDIKLVKELAKVDWSVR